MPNDRQVTSACYDKGVYTMASELLHPAEEPTWVLSTAPPAQGAADQGAAHW